MTEKRKKHYFLSAASLPGFELASIGLLVLLGFSPCSQVSGAVSTIALEPGEKVTMGVGAFFDLPPIVMLETNLGAIPIELTPEAAPATVENFLFYVDSGRYADSFIHRSATLEGGVPFVIQGGGFFFNFEKNPVQIESVPTQDPVVNEFNVSNTRGTVAMAKLSGNPDSATSQWFINLSDNGTILDGLNGGFTVFGRVIADGMAVADAISEVTVYNAVEQLGSPFGELPLLNNTLNTVNFIVIESASRYVPEVTANFPNGGAEFFEITMVGSVISIEALPGASDTFPLELTATFLEGDPQIQTLDLAVASSAQWYDSARNAGGGWRYFDWFKGFQPTESKWIFHARHGWLFVLAEDTQKMFLWDSALGRWLWTNENVYPWMYAYGPNEGWIFFFEGGRPGKRFFRRGDSGELISEADLKVSP